MGVVVAAWATVGEGVVKTLMELISILKWPLIKTFTGCRNAYKIRSHNQNSHYADGISNSKKNHSK